MFFKLSEPQSPHHTLKFHCDSTVLLIIKNVLHMLGIAVTVCISHGYSSLKILLEISCSLPHRLLLLVILVTPLEAPTLMFSHHKKLL